MSGTALHYWAVTALESHVDLAYEMAVRWNEPQRDVDGLIKLLKSVPAHKFNEYANISVKGTADFKFGPVVECMFCTSLLSLSSFWLTLFQ